jgi:2'-5' RNA ligase
MRESATHKRLIGCYDRLWTEAPRRIRTGRPDLDPVLQARLPDRRRGLTSIVRPAADVRRHVGKFLRELRSIEPAQYYYSAADLHVTILSLFTVTVRPEPFLARRAEYVSAVDAALRSVPPFRIEFRGVTATPGTVLIQGFRDKTEFNDLRDGLRRQLRLRSLTEGLDRRYRLETAHMTVVRFRARLRDTDRFLAPFERSRHRGFGVIRIQTLSLVQNDWYMTRQALGIIRHYRLHTNRRGQ